MKDKGMPKADFVMGLILMVGSLVIVVESLKIPDFEKDRGGGVDTQGVLPHGTPQQVRDDVRRNIEALAPGGGYVFNTIHNIQADVPPENIIAMWQALQEYGVY